MEDLAIWLFFLFLGALVWFWIDSMRALDAARKYGKKACNDLDLQFIDDAVVRTKLQITRNHYGRRVFRRTYHFEFTETGNSRLEGELILEGHKLESVTMEPYQMATEPNLLNDAHH